MEVQEIKEYHNNGFLKSVYFLNKENKKHGLYKEYWYNDGSLMQMCFYVNGVIEQRTIFYKHD
jgi:antitoxin component YwqK of YwqJK toxin-antitoxin module